MCGECRMLTYADVRILTYADVCWVSAWFTLNQVCGKYPVSHTKFTAIRSICSGSVLDTLKLVGLFADVCWRTLTYADVCSICSGSVLDTLKLVGLSAMASPSSSRMTNSTHTIILSAPGHRCFPFRKTLNMSANHFIRTWTGAAKKWQPARNS